MPSTPAPSPDDPPPQGGWALVVHGGAGVITPADLSPAQEAAYRGAMARA
ncbi:MAG: hypothetical protein JWO72_740, partial [Caulobacteraceae bacterium]|nr:hypothetical protein [Caulobacteraceae bacterium]